MASSAVKKEEAPPTIASHHRHHSRSDDDSRPHHQPKRVKHEDTRPTLPLSNPPPAPSIPSPPPPPPPPKQSIQLSLSGTLASHALTTPTGSVLKYHPPSDSALPSLHYRLYAFSPTGGPPSVLHLHRQATYAVGRDGAVNDLIITHPSVSKQHAVVQYRRVKGSGGEVVPYLMDLGSVNGSFLNGQRVEGARFVELRERDVLTFGTCGKDYVLLHAESRDTEEGAGGKGKAAEEARELKERTAAGEAGGAVKKKRPAWADDDDDDF